MIEMLDMDKYKNDPEKNKRIVFIRKVLEARLDRNLQDKDMVIKYANGGILDNDFIDVSTFRDLSNSEIDWVNETVSSAIKYAFIYDEAPYMADLWNRFLSCDYKTIDSIVREIETATARLNTKFRKAKVESNSDRTFSLTPEVLVSAVTDSWQEVTSSYRKLYTGMQGFNQFIGGGFENTRSYLFLGTTGIGKSMVLLNIVYQLKKYNKGFKPKDPTKRPCIVYFTLENTITETIQRLFKICTGEDFQKQASPEEAINKFMTEGELYLTDESPIDIIFKYKPNKSEDTSYLYTLVEDLEDEGYEVIALVQDHAKRIRSTERNQDLRIELGDIINEFKTFAMIKDIPVITNSHLNRDAARIVDENASKSKSDITRLLGKHNIGESMLMLDNVDFSAIIGSEYDKDGRKWMTFSEIKKRIETYKEYICQPCDVNNSIKLVEDFYSNVPVFRETMYEGPAMNMNKPTENRYVNNLPLDDEDDNVYSFTNKYESIYQEKEKKPMIKPFTINLGNCA